MSKRSMGGTAWQRVQEGEQKGSPRSPMGLLEEAPGIRGSNGKCAQCELTDYTQITE